MRWAGSAKRNIRHGCGLCSYAETLALIADSELDTASLIPQTDSPEDIETACHLFANRWGGVTKVAI